MKGSKTGVFIGASASESHEAWATDPDTTVGYSMTGCTRSMFSNRLSYFFDFKGEKLVLHGLRTDICTRNRLQHKILNFFF